LAEKSYREIIANWCNEIEFTFIDVKDHLIERMDENEIQTWEEQLSLLKREVEAEVDIQDEVSLYEKATLLHDELNSFLIQAERQEGMQLQPVPIGGHRLPQMPYRYDALEPVIAEEIMRLHHTKHHQGYVDGLNKAEKEMKIARDNNDFSLIKHWEREAAFHGSGHYLHTIFWNIMSPDGGGKPSGRLKTVIDQSFGSFDKFKKHFTEAAKNVEAVGWAILVWSPRAHRLEILTAEKHQNLTQWDTIPLLVLDVWEHAYYLQYKNEKGKYVENWWKVVNWKGVEGRFNKARKLTWQPY